jgi:hypothetical protein
MSIYFSIAQVLTADIRMGSLPIIACHINITAGQLLLILFYIVGWWTSAALALVNPILLARLNGSRRFDALNVFLWVFYVLPGIVVLLELFDKVHLHLPPFLLVAYSLAIPFVTVSHFAFLFYKRRKLRAQRAQIAKADAKRVDSI